jgi:hypothetical protein
MFVTGGPAVRGGGGFPQRIRTISRSPPTLPHKQGRVVRERLAWAAGCRRFDSVPGIERPWRFGSWSSN